MVLYTVLPELKNIFIDTRKNYRLLCKIQVQNRDAFLRETSPGLEFIACK